MKIRVITSRMHVKDLTAIYGPGVRGICAKYTALRGIDPLVARACGFSSRRRVVLYLLKKRKGELI